MFLLESQKGIAHARPAGAQAQRQGNKAGISHELDCILIARDRTGQTIDAVTGRGAVMASQLARHLLPKLDPKGCW